MTSQKDDARASAVSGEAPEAAAGKPASEVTPPARAGVTRDCRAASAAPCVLLDHHRRMIEDASRVTPGMRAARGYFSATKKVELKDIGFPPSQQIVPTLVIPIYGTDGELKTYQHRPDTPRLNKRGKTVKYETRAGSSMVLDVHPLMRHLLGDINVPAVVGEGIKKGDALASLGILALNMLGVSGYRGTNELGGKTLLADWQHVALNDGRKLYMCFDSDVMEKIEVYRQLSALRDVLRSKGADVWVIYLPHGPNGEKVGVDDWFAADPSRTVDDLFALAQKELKAPPSTISEHRKIVDALPDAPAHPELVVPLGYEVGPRGVVKVDIVGEGESMRERRTGVAPRPIYVSGIIEDIGGGDHQLVLAGRYRERWIRALATREQVMDARKLTALANTGLPMASVRAGLLSEYLDAFEAENLDKLPVARVGQQMAWTPSIREFLLGSKTLNKESE